MSGTEAGRVDPGGSVYISSCADSSNPLDIPLTSRMQWGLLHRWEKRRRIGMVLARSWIVSIGKPGLYMCLVDAMGSPNIRSSPPLSTRTFILISDFLFLTLNF